MDNTWKKWGSWPPQDSWIQPSTTKTRDRNQHTRCFFQQALGNRSINNANINTRKRHYWLALSGGTERTQGIQEVLSYNTLSKNHCGLQREILWCFSSAGYLVPIQMVPCRKPLEDLAGHFTEPSQPREECLGQDGSWSWTLGRAG